MPEDSDGKKPSPEDEVENAIRKQAKATVTLARLTGAIALFTLVLAAFDGVYLYQGSRLLEQNATTSKQIDTALALVCKTLYRPPEVVVSSFEGRDILQDKVNEYHIPDISSGSKATIHVMNKGGTKVRLDFSVQMRMRGRTVLCTPNHITPSNKQELAAGETLKLTIDARTCLAQEFSDAYMGEAFLVMTLSGEPVCPT